MAYYGGHVTPQSTASYGSNATSWKKTSVMELPRNVKNRELDQQRQSVRTSGEEYGQFWQQQGDNERHVSVSQAGYYRENQRDPYQSHERSQELSRDDGYGSGSYGGRNGVAAHARVSLPPVTRGGSHGSNTRDYIADDVSNAGSVRSNKAAERRMEAIRRKAKERDRNSQVKITPTGRKSTSLPPLPSQTKYDELTRHTKQPVNRHPRVTQETKHVAGRNTRRKGVEPTTDFPDVKRIDINLHTADNQIVTISAVPLLVQVSNKGQ